MSCQKKKKTKIAYDDNSMLAACREIVKRQYLGFGEHRLQQTNDLGANRLALSTASCDLSGVERHLLYKKGKGNAGIIIWHLVVRLRLV